MLDFLLAGAFGWWFMASKYEEIELSEKMGNAYKDYSFTVKRLIPYVW